MLKTTIICIFLIFMVFFASAETKENPSLKRFSLSWSAGFDSQPEVSSRTTVNGVGFIIFHNEKLDIRNQILIANGVLIQEDIGIKNYKKDVRNKLSVGVTTHGDLLRPYGFLLGGFGTCGSKLWEFQKNPLIGIVGLGAGLDIFATERWNFFMELGFIGHIFKGEFIPQQGIKFGTMLLF